MKNIFKGSLILTFFSISITVFNISCNKEISAQNNTSNSLPIATTSNLGGVIVGQGLTVTSNGTISTQNAGLLVFAKGGDKPNEFWSSKFDGSNQTKITIALPATAEIVKESIKISPDGKKFFFTLNLNPVLPTSQDAIYSCNIDGSGLTKLVDNIGEFSDAK
jgi:hypothetical protein